MTTTTRETATAGGYGTADERTARMARYRAAAARCPQGAMRLVRSLSGRNEYRAEMAPDVLATFSADELVDIADGGPYHFGGAVDRDAAAGTADITVWID